MWYDTGTVAVANGSTIVTGTGTDFISGAQIGEAFLAPDDKLYEIQSITSATTLVLADSYLGSTQSGQDYKIIPTQSLVADLASQVTDLITDYSNVKDTAGAGKFNDGTVTAPAITFEQDQNNGLYRIGSDNWGMSAGGQKQVDISTTDVELNYSGSKKLATTATGVDVTGTITADGLTGSLNSFSAVSSSAIAAKNNFKIDIDSDSVASNRTFTVTHDGGSKTLLNVAETGDVSFYEDTGTTAKMVWSSSAESLGIGTASPSSDLTIYKGNAEVTIANSSGSTGSTSSLLFSNGSTIEAKAGLFFEDKLSNNRGDLHIAVNGNTLGDPVSKDDAVMTMTSAGNVGIGTASPAEKLETYKASGQVSNLVRSGGVYTYLTSDTTGFGRLGTGSVHPLLFQTAGVERARIDSSGNLLVGKTSADSSVDGFGATSGGYATVSDTNFASFFMNRNGTDGDIAQFRKNGSSVGSISVENSNINIGSGDTGMRFDSTNNTLIPVNMSTNVVQTGTTDLGSSSYRWKNLYLTGGVINSSDYRLKEDVQPMQSYADKVKQMNLVNFAWKDSGEREDGFIAHELQAVIPKAVVGEKDAIDADGKPEHQGIDSLKLIPILTKALQEALERIETLENK